ncbi:hypothetical protein INT45_013945 [Circinella minor]|uniref:No apical meristem-associated C-terminal domain-containing protein n=1 Tax=Circinella minor TaxID=1195481 RepID=A0A8H7S0D4_9FUNG|nr:hypothetical protein INT45_013945 [Circinella minor]
MDKKKCPALSKAEDIALVKAYLGVTTNPTVGTNLTEEGLWSSAVEGLSRIAKTFLIVLSHHLNHVSILSRRDASFSRPAMQKCMRPEKVYEQTCARYVDFRPANSWKAFGLRHAWDLLKVEEKWKPRFPKESNEVEVVEETQPRPIGKHQAKAAKATKRKRPLEDEDSTNKQLLEIMRIQLEVDRERIATSKAHAYHEKVMMSHEIMSVDPATLPSYRRYYYEKMQKKIVEKMKKGEEEEKEKQKIIGKVVEDVEVEEGGE